MKRICVCAVFLICAVGSLLAGSLYEGSLRPYPVPRAAVVYPDSLTPVYVSHVGRHGSRYPASNASARLMRSYLVQADTLGCLTPLGREFLKAVDMVISVSSGRWGDLDSIGMSEQRGIASRMYLRFPNLLDTARIEALSSNSPRSVMSMYMFTQRLTECSRKLSVTAREGADFSPLMRPFDVDTAYLGFRARNEWKPAYDGFFASACPLRPIRSLIGPRMIDDLSVLRELAITQYYLIAGMSAMGIDFDYSPYYSADEYKALWSIFNLRQYLQRTASEVSRVPARIASRLLSDIIAGADARLASGADVAVNLRFGHAETLMPLLSLMQLPGCFYLTTYYDTVSSNWRDYDVVPMASNLQLIFFRSVSGRIYVAGELNERPVALLRGSDAPYVLWNDLRARWLELVFEAEMQ